MKLNQAPFKIYHDSKDLNVVDQIDFMHSKFVAFKKISQNYGHNSYNNHYIRYEFYT